LNTVALLVYPGLLACALLGVAAEVVSARVSGARHNVLSTLWPTLRQEGVPPLATGAALLALLAASQLALPFSPVPPTERNVVAAAVAVVSASWLAWGWGLGRAYGTLDARLVLAAQACWLVALLAPALVAQSLRPQVLGAVVVLSALPLKLVAAVLFLVCLPVLLQLVPEAAPQGLPGAVHETGGRGLERAGFVGVRMLLWLPLCGLFASVFMPPGNDALEFLGFAAATLGAAAAAIVLAALVSHWRLLSARGIYLRLGLPLALFSLLLAGLAQLYPQGL
jgi:hypothetical protein